MALGFALELKGETDIKKATKVTPDTAKVKYGPNSVVVEVDYRDDEGTRLRQAGLLKGPLPLASQTSNVAGGSCTFAIDCADGNRCTIDFCDIAPGSPLGSGTCVHQPVPDGDAGGCGDGLFCNGLEVCQAGVCTNGPAPTCCAGRDFCNEVFGRCDEDSANVGTKCIADGNCAGGLCNFCLTDCNDLQCNYQSDPSKIGASCETNADCTGPENPSAQCTSGNPACDDGLVCNGVETCNPNGLCQEGINPCGFGANCSELRCTGAGARPCTVGGEACPGSNTCTVPIGCFHGRCCSDPAPPGDPVCSNAKLATAPTPLCTTKWYASDLGGYDPTDPCGNDSPSGPGSAQGCPKYSSGITVSGVNDLPTWPVNIGPVSDATTSQTVGTYTGVLNRIGDDYTIVNGSHIGLDSVRWVGGMLVANRILLELWDGSGNFIEDAVLPPIAANATPEIIVVNFVPRITIPPTGYVTWKIASNFSPNAQMYIMSTDIEDAGVNDETKLWLNSGPVSNFLTPNPGILAFEITGAKVNIPLGACCNDSGGCQETTEWLCVGGGGVFQQGAGCSACVGGGNAGAACTTCNGDGVDACTNDDDCTGAQLCLPNNAVCTGMGSRCSNNGETPCTTNANCPGVPNQCSNEDRFCNSNGDCPFGGVCGGAGTCQAGVCQLPGCNVGACCNSGVCTNEITEAQCVTLTGNALNFLGFGTTCDEDAGLDGAQQDCCKRPGDASLTQRCDRTGAVCTSDSQCLNHNCFDTATCFTTATCTGGLCSAGPLAGEECEVNEDCDACVGGPLAGDSCVTAAECRACETGRYAGLVCTNDASCGNCADASPNDDAKYDEDCDDGLCFTGGDNPADAIVQAITVPASGSSPVTVTITGNNGGASSTTANPDACFGEATTIGSEPGWFEAFSINKEALVRIDFCCTKPVHEPAWAFMSADPDCNNLIGSAPNPFRPQEQAGARGPNYCNEDNLWQWFGILPAGTYYYPIYSIVSGHVGQYQLHITVEPMPEGACCLPEGDPEYAIDHCDDDDPDTTGITVTECEARGGLFLGPPNRFPVVGLCSTGVCDTGSCCVGPGDCDDREGSPPNEAVTRAECDTLNGTFVTHVKCKGGRCANNINFSCGSADDCLPAAGGPGCPGVGTCCVGDPAALDQKNPCPICEYSDDTVCQHDPGTFDGTAYLADRSSAVQPTRIADDVLVTSTGVMTHVCVIGIYVNFDGGASDCSVEADFDLVIDSYQVRVYLPESATSYVPGQLVGTYNTIIFENQLEPEYTSGYRFWRHQLELVPGADPLPTLQANQVYFIEVSNNSQGGPVGCNWYWINAADGEGNNIFFQDLGAAYTAADVETSGATTNGDIALCMNVPFSTPDEPIRACCTGVGLCQDMTVRDCLAANGAWQFGTLTCPVEGACPAPSNNLCTNAILVGDGPIRFDNFGTTTTGSTSELCEFAPTATEIADLGELWYQYEASCTGNALFSTCNREYFQDDVISVYMNTQNSGICGCPGDAGMTLVECFDSGQDNPVNPTGCNTFGDQAEVYIPVVAGNCYTVRVATFDAAGDEIDNPFPQNLGQLRISCGAAGGDFPICGNGTIDAGNGEQCDGPNADALCDGECSVECRCPPPPCGDNIAETGLGEACDGTADANCPGDCTAQCTCPPECGNGVKEQGEQCDEPDDSLCPGLCNPAGPGGCTCIHTCGNNDQEVGEACDGTDDDNCPGACVNCACPVPTCGNNVVETLNNEECDGTATTELGSGCDPAECRPPGDAAGECTCACGVTSAPPPDPITGNTFGTCSGSGNAVCDTVTNICGAGQGPCEACNQVRYLSFKVPATSAGNDTAIRVRLDSLHHPTAPPQGALPVYTLLEGGDRYLNTIAGTLSRCCNPNSNPTSCNTSVSCNTNADCAGLGLNTTCYKNMCPDSTAFATYFRCAKVGCTPEYRDWSDFAGLVTYATGDSVIPSSSYSVSHLAASCAGNEAACQAASAPLTVGSERWGNVDCSNGNNGIPAAADIGQVTAKVRDALGAPIKPRAHLRLASLDPLTLVNASDIGRIVDAVKGLHYPFNIKCTTATACTTNAQCVSPATCSSNGKCTTAKDSCTGICQP